MYQVKNTFFFVFLIICFILLVLKQVLRELCLREGQKRLTLSCKAKKQKGVTGQNTFHALVVIL